MSRTDHKPAGAFLSSWQQNMVLLELLGLLISQDWEVRAAPQIYIIALEFSGRGEEVDGYHYGYI